MKVKDIKETLSPFTPIWVNENDGCDYYESVDDIPSDLDSKDVTYMTIDGENKLTIEL